MPRTAAHYPHLFTPGRIGTLEIDNRILKSPQSTATSNADGTVTARRSSTTSDSGRAASAWS